MAKFGVNEPSGVRWQRVTHAFGILLAAMSLHSAWDCTRIQCQQRLLLLGRFFFMLVHLI